MGFRAQGFEFRAMVVMVSRKEGDLAQGEAEDLAIHFLLLLLLLLLALKYEGGASDAHEHDIDARKYGSDRF